MKLTDSRARSLIDRVHTIAFGVMLFAIGILSLAATRFVPPSMENSLEPIALYAWSILIILSSPMLVVGRLLYLYKLEAAGSLGVAASFLVYMLALSSRFPDSSVLLLLLLGFIVSYGYRGYALNKVERSGEVKFDGDTVWYKPSR